MPARLFALTLTLIALACSSPAPTPPATYNTDAAADGAAEDGAALGDATSSSDAQATDTLSQGGADAGSKDAGSKDSGQTFPDGFLEPIDGGSADAGVGEDSGPAPVLPVGKLYAHTSTELYQLDLATKAIVKKGEFKFNKNKDKITDIALDKFGKLYAIGFDHVFTCDTQNAKCIWLAKLPDSFNGMTFVPEGVVTPGKDALIGISSQGEWTHIRLDGGAVTLKKLGQYGGGWLSSGDAFSVVGVGTFATLKGKGDTDSLAEIDPATGKIVKIIGETGAKGLFGLAWWAGKFYAFSKTGQVYTLNLKTGKATEETTLKAPSGVSWWGAGVSTRANGG